MIANNELVDVRMSLEDMRTVSALFEERKLEANYRGVETHFAPIRSYIERSMLKVRSIGKTTKLVALLKYTGELPHLFNLELVNADDLP